MRVRLSEVGEDFDAEAEKQRMHFLLDKYYVKSIWYMDQLLPTATDLPQR